MPQIKLDLSEVIIEYLKFYTHDFGFRYPAQFASYVITEAFDKLPEFEDIDSEDLAMMKRYVSIGKSASKMKGRKFSIANSVKDHEETVKGYDEVLKRGWITEKTYTRLVKESESEHKKNIKRELQKMEIERKRKLRKKNRK